MLERITYPGTPLPHLAVKKCFRKHFEEFGGFLSMSNPISLHGPATNLSLPQKLMFWFVGLTVCQVQKVALGNNHSNPHNPQTSLLIPLVPDDKLILAQLW